VAIEVEPDTRPQAWLVRHGETAWSKSGQHTGRTDVPLTAAGRAQAQRLRRKMGRRRFALALSSPMARALETARLAGFDRIEIDPDLHEWNYGQYEGLTTPQIRETVPGWSVWTHPIPGGESADEVAARVDRVIARVRGATEGDAVIFAHGHILRVLAARWLGLPATDGRLLALGTATVSVLGWERETPVVERWNAPAAEG
jgi:broad specificity phosphatase PhoE